MYQYRMNRVLSWSVLATAIIGLVLLEEGLAEDVPLTRDVPIEEFQNRAEVPPYNFDAPPQGLIRSIQFAEGFDEELGYRRSHEMVPVSPTDIFRPDSPAVFIVFQTHQHYESYQIFGRCYPEQVEGLDTKRVIAEDVMYMALEDESGYLKLFPPSGGWRAGKYKVEIHIGWKINEISLIGTMRFTVAPSNHASSATVPQPK